MSTSPIKVEAYLLLRPPMLLRSEYDNVGIIDELNLIHWNQYPSLPGGIVIDISDYIPENGIQSWNLSIDLQEFTRFETADFSLKLSLLKSNNLQRTVPYADGHFYNKLASNELWQLIENISSFIDHEINISVAIPELNIGYFGYVDPRNIQMSEKTGEVTITAYDVMSKLSEIPASHITDSNGTARFWYITRHIDDAFRLIWYNAAGLAEFGGYDFRPGDIYGSGKYCLSFYAPGDVDNGIPEDEQISELTYDGYNYLLTTQSDCHKTGNLSPTDVWYPDSTYGGDMFFPWENQTATNSVRYPLIGRFGTNSEELSINHGYYYDYSQERFWYLDYEIIAGNRYLQVKYRDTTGGVGAIAWDSSPTTFASFRVPKDGPRDEIRTGITRSTSSDLYLIYHNKLYKIDGLTGSEEMIASVSEGERYYSIHRYYGDTGINPIICTVTKVDSNEIEYIEIRDQDDGSLLKTKSGKIPTGNNFDQYNLHWNNINYGEMLRLNLDWGDDAEDCFVGIAYEYESTQDWNPAVVLRPEKYYVGRERHYWTVPRHSVKAVKFFILDSNLEKCYYYSDIGGALGFYFGDYPIVRLTRARTSYVVWEDRGGTSYPVTYYDYNITGYIGGGTINNGLFFTFALTHTGNIRLLNLKDQNAVGALAEVAKFSASYLYNEDEVKTIAGMQMAQPKLHIVGRDRYAEEAQNWELDRWWTNWDKTALFDQYAQRIDIRYSGGVAVVGSGTYAGVSKSKFYDVDTANMNLNFVYDMNFAIFRGSHSINWLGTPRQLWRITTPIIFNDEGRTFRLLDTVELRKDTVGYATGVIIAIQFMPYSRSAQLTIISDKQGGLQRQEITEPFPLGSRDEDPVGSLPNV